MSETTSSPSIHVHSISSSSSFSSTDSAPHSEPTSDEQPDLGAFTTVLRELTHLQPLPRIPIQIRSATSSTTPTYQPDESTVGSINRSHSQRSRNSRFSGRSGISSFTRPPSSSAAPEGSTVWNHAPIASYLYSNTPSNDLDEEEEDRLLRDDGRSPSSPNSLASTALTVEIASETDFPSFDGSNQQDDEQEIELPVRVESESQRLDSRETARAEEELDQSSVQVSSEDVGESSSSTSRVLQSSSYTSTEPESQSLYLQSQARVPTTTAMSSSDSLFIPALPSVPTALPTVSSLSNFPSLQSNNHNTTSTSSPSTSTTSTLMTALLARSRNPVPPRTISDSSYATNESASSSNLSLVSYQIPETPPESDHEQRPLISDMASASIQQPNDESVESVSYSSQPPQAALQPIVAQAPSPPSSTASVSSAALPLTNPYSPLRSITQSTSSTELNDSRGGTRLSTVMTDWHASNTTDLFVANDFTPDQTPSETILTGHLRRHSTEFSPVNDIDREEGDLGVLDVMVQPHITQLTSNIDNRPGPSSDQKQLPLAPSVVSEKKHHPEPQLEVDDGEDDDEEVGYSYRYPIAHTPKSYSQAQTPRGVPTKEPHLHPETVTNPSSSLTTHAATSSALPQTTYIHSNSETQPPFVFEQQQHQPIQQSSRLPAQSSSTSQTGKMAMNSSMPQPQQDLFYPISNNQNGIAQTHDLPLTQPANLKMFTNPLMVSSDHTYPHSLLGLHALPTSLVSHGTEELRSLDVPAESHSANGNDTTLTEPVNVFVAASDSSGEILDTGNNSDHTLPSLGYLDEALRFIAAERARWSALRVASASNTHVNAPADDGDNMDDGSGEELEAGEGEGDLEWKRLDDGQEPEQPKKRRRRKRPPKTHAIPVASEVFKADISSMTTSKGPSLDAQSNVNTITPSASPKKKKRSKSIPASVHSSSQSLLTGSPASGKGKNKKQVQEKMFLVPPPATQAITILRRPVQDSGQIKERAHTSEEDVQIDVALDSDIDGAKTPTNLSSTYSGSLASKVSSESSPINLMGKKGKRVGRKEREREKMKRDLETGKARESNVGEKPKAPADDFGIEYTDDGDNIDEGFETRDDGDNDDEDHGENDSISNMALLQPPRRKRNRSLRRKAADTAYIHSVIGIGELPAAYKSTPATPKKILYDGEELADEDEFKPISGALVTEVKVDVDHADDVFISKPGPEDGVPVEGGGEKKRRFRAKRVKALTHASSEPELRAEASVVEEASTTGTSSAAHENIGTSKSKKGKKKMPLGVEKDSLDMDRNKIQKPISVSGVRLSANQKHNKTDISESVVFPSTSKRGRIIALATKLKQLFPEQQEELARIVARLERQGAAPPQARNGRAMIWDSAGVALSSRTAPIAIPGMTKKRFRKGHARTTSEGTGAGTGAEGLDYDSTEGGFGGGVGVRLKAHFPEIGEEDGDEEEEIDPRGRPPRKNDALIHVFIDHSNILIGFLSHVKRHPPQRKFVDIGRGRPLPAVLTTATTFNPNPADSTASAKGSHTRPLPIQSNSDAKRRNYPIPLPSFATASRSLPAHSTLSSYTSDGQDKCGNSAEHETGVVANDVAGSDTLFVGSLHRTKEKKVLKHLWHAALTLILERGRPITRRVVVTSSPLYQPMDAIERLGYELGVFIRVPDFGDGMDRERHNRSNGRPNGGVNKNGSSPVTAGTLSGSPKKVSTAGHARHASGNISTESSGDGSGNGASAPNIRIKYREQGVDELLQLKLHQALAATDYVPEGSTIVLATGDGNVGQFNEDGFLGPVRTALKRGWRVELYAWEDGLSRSWRREFGSGSEWGRRGMFRIIGMEQFASSLLTTFE